MGEVLQKGLSELRIEKHVDVVENVGNKRAHGKEALGPHAKHPDGSEIVLNDMFVPAEEVERKVTFNGSNSFRYPQVMPEKLLRRKALEENREIIIETSSPPDVVARGS